MKQFKTKASIPMDFRDVIKQSLLRVSNALLKSIKITSRCSISLIFRFTKFENSPNRSSVLLPLRNPYCDALIKLLFSRNYFKTLHIYFSIILSTTGSIAMGQ
jgi:hypothetical protein